MPIDSSIQHPQAQSTTFMNNDLYKAALEGNLEAFTKYQVEGGDLRSLVDGIGNTALHIYSGNDRFKLVKTTRFLCFPEWHFEEYSSTQFVEQLVDKCPSLLLQPNNKGETPLHIAVQYSRHEIVESLIKRAKEMPLPLPQPYEDLEEGAGSWLRTMLRIKDEEGNTAFHKGVERCDIQVLQPLLVKELDPHFSFSANRNGETPIYIAAKTCSNDDVVDAILDHCKSIYLDYGGPAGQTALHAAVVAVDYKKQFGSSIVEKLIKARKQLIREKDDKGRTPLHYAAYVGNGSGVKLMLEMDASAAYMTEKERGMTALHMAAWSGREEIMKSIISISPGCCVIVDKKGWNFLHYAAVCLQEKQFWRLFEIVPNTNFFYQEDVNGNTPSNVFYVFSHSRRSNSSLVFKPLNDKILDKSMSDSDATYKKKKKQIRGMINEIYNTAEVEGFPQHKSFREYTEDDNNPSTLEKTVNKMRENHLLVATLIATVTFTAAIAVPGGYKEGNANDKGTANDQGTATLSHDSAFKAFILTNAMAFVSSLLAIFLNFLSLYIHSKVAESMALICVLTADGFTVFAMAAMVVAFSTGSYAVLGSSMGVAITTCSVGLTFFLFSLLVPYLIYYFFKRNP